MEEYTLAQGLTAVGFGNFQGLVLAYSGLGWFAEAMEIMILSFVGPAVKSEWGISSGEESLLTTAVFAGMLVGAYSWGTLSDIYGRRRGLLGIAMVSSGAGFLSAFSPNYISLVVLRCLVGFGLGGGPVFSSWFLEFVPASNRGVWMVVFSTFWTFGTIFEASLAWIVMPRLNWRWLLALSSLPSFVLLFFYGIAPESPMYLTMKGRTSDAVRILEKMAKFNQRKLPPGVLIFGTSTRLDEEIDPVKDTLLLPLARNNSNESKHGDASIFMLFSRKLIKTTFLLWILLFGSAFSYYAVILLTSELSSKKNKCDSSTLLTKISQSDSLYLNVFITSLAELPGTVLSAILVDRVGRKRSMSIMFVLACFFLLPLVSHQLDILTTGSLFGARMFISGAFTVGCIYAPEIYPTHIRSTGAGVASAVARIGGMICPLVSVGLITGCHQTAAIVILEVIMVLSALSVTLIPFETNGQNLS